MTTNERVRVFPGPAALGESVARHLLERIEAAAAEGRGFVLGCPGGRSPVPIYRALGRLVAARALGISHVTIAMMDDYVTRTGDGWERVPPGAHFSCEGFAHREIRDVLNAGAPSSGRIPAAGVLLPDPNATERYEPLLEGLGGIDFFLLASGAGDGHVAFNPPGTPEDSGARVVELAEQTRRDNLATFPDFAGLDEVPTHGVTVGTGTIRRLSREALMVLIGGDKRTAFARLSAGGGYDPMWPATIYRTVPGAMLYADEAAAGGTAAGAR